MSTKISSWIHLVRIINRKYESYNPIKLSGSEILMLYIVAQRIYEYLILTA
jgi:hypothetical protein